MYLAVLPFTIGKWKELPHHNEARQVERSEGESWPLYIAGKNASHNVFAATILADPKHGSIVHQRMIH